ncbi:MAG TPA: hypothetical protein VEC11_08200 [Allosphingosinicella sp.]|nr:hypothetical protein [Allosphingosinicella sp.]
MRNYISIPDARVRLRELAEAHGIDELHEIADSMYRRTATRRAQVRSPKVTAEMAEEIRQFAAANPDLHQQDIANHFGVNVGRVSEALHHDR